MPSLFNRPAGRLLLGALLTLLACPLAWAQSCVNAESETVPTCLDETNLLNNFTTLLDSTQGTSFLQQVLSTDEQIYASASPSRRILAAEDALYSWPDQSGGSDNNAANILVGAFPTNATFYYTVPSLSQIGQLSAITGGVTGLYGTGQILATGTPLEQAVETITSLAAAGDLKGYYNYDNVYVNAFGYAAAYTGPHYSDPQYINTGKYNGEPRPFETIQAIAQNPWTTADSSSFAAATQSEGNESWQSYQTSAAFPSGHTTAGTVDSIVLAILAPGYYQQLVNEGVQFALSRNIFGVHYPTDTIAGRIIATYAVAESLAGNNADYARGNAAFNNGNLPSLSATLGSELATAGFTSSQQSPYAACATNIVGCITNNVIPSATTYEANLADYTYYLIYGLPDTNPTGLAPVVPADAYVLIQSRFPYLNQSQLNAILASTEIPSGSVFDVTGAYAGWDRLNLYAAAGGYGAFTSNVTVDMNSALGGFNAFDVWSNDISGSGGLTLQGSGTLILAGNDSYTGGTTVAGGTLALTGTLGGNLTIANGAEFVSNGGYSVASGSSFINNGTFIDVNTTLTNAGTATNAGAFYGNLSNSGSFTNSGTLTGNVGNGGALLNSGLLTGTITNSGSFTNAGAVTGAVTNSGTLLNGGSIAGAILNSSSFANTGTVTGNVTNSGTLQNSGTIAGAVINSSSFANTGTVTGAVTNNGTLQNGGMIAGDVTTSGLLTNSGQIGGLVSEAAGGTILGQGSYLGGLTIGGTIAATANTGGNPAAIQAAGPVTILPGATDIVQLGANGSSQILTTATATLTGGTVSVALGSSYVPGFGSYTILRAAGGLSGQFASDTNPFSSTFYPFLGTSLSYSDTSVDLVVGRGASLAGAGQTANESAAGMAADALPLNSSLLQSLSLLNYQSAPAALALVSGDIYASDRTVMQEQSSMLRQTVQTRLGSSLGSGDTASGPVAAGTGPDSSLTFWQQAVGATGTNGSDGNASALSQTQAGYLLGADLPFAGGARAGIAVGYDQTNMRTDGGAASASGNEALLALYGGQRLGRLTLSLGAGYAWNNLTVSRTVSFPGFTGSSQSSPGGGTVQSWAEADYALPAGPLLLSPFTQLAFVSAHTPSFTESAGTGTAGSLAAALSGDAETQSNGYATLGLKGSLPLTLRGFGMTLSALAGWQRLMGPSAPSSTLALSGADFTVSGVPLAANSAVLGLSLSAQLTERARFSLGYSGQYSGAAANSGLAGTLALAF